MLHSIIVVTIFIILLGISASLMEVIPNTKKIFIIILCAIVSAALYEWLVTLVNYLSNP